MKIEITVPLPTGWLVPSALAGLAGRTVLFGSGESSGQGEVLGATASIGDGGEWLRLIVNVTDLGVIERSVLGALPSWPDLSDLDKGAVLLHLRKCENEGGDYATDQYSARFFDHPALLDLDRVTASRYAQSFAEEEGWEISPDLLDPESDDGFAEYSRLYDLALDAYNARMRAELGARRG